jgi:hypothetical protein
VNNQVPGFIEAAIRLRNAAPTLMLVARDCVVDIVLQDLTKEFLPPFFGH